MPLYNGSLFEPSAFLRDASSSLGLYLQGVSDNELGGPVLQNVFETVGFNTVARNDEDTVSQVASIITTKFNKFRTALERIVAALDDGTRVSSHAECCSIPPHQFKYDPRYGGVAVNTRMVCSLHTPATTAANLSSVLQHNLATVPGLVWQYTLGGGGLQLVSPAHQPRPPHSAAGCGAAPQPAHSRVYLQTVHRASKSVVLVVDRSSALSSHQFRLTLDTLRFLVSSLGPGDRVSLVLVSASNPIVVDLRPGDSCTSGSLVRVTEDIRTDLLSYVSRIGQEGGEPDTALGLAFAYKVLVHSGHKLDDPAQLLFITGRKFESLTEEQRDAIIFSIKRERKEVRSHNISLSFVMMQNLGQRMFPDRDFVQRMVEAGGSGGGILTLQTSAQLAQLGDWYSASPHSSAGPPLVSLPRADDLSQKVTVVLSQVSTSGTVAAVEAALPELIEDVFWVERDRDSRMFLIDVNGVVLAHPALALATVTRHLHISLLEPELGAASAALLDMRTVPSGSVAAAGRRYSWARADTSPYIVVAAARDTADTVTRLDTVTAAQAGAGFQYHSLVTSGSTKLCRHLSEAASMQTAALYLAPAAFARPADQLGPADGGVRTQSYLAYLTDPTRLIANPGLRAGVRDEVLAVARLTDTWKQHAYRSPLNNYIVRRRVVTGRGVQLSYPGAGVAAPDWDPTLSPWYATAVRLAGLVTVSPPHLDPGGAGYIVTMASVVAALNRTTSTVIAADFTQGYFHKIVNETLPGSTCSQENTTCFLMDHRGYLVTHPRMDHRDPRATSVHLTHLEPAVATDLLSDHHPGFLTKSVCRNPDSGTLARVFSVELEGGGAVRSSGDTCSQYTLERVAGTNLWLGLVTSSCEAARPLAAFCWCSTVDTSCLDCSRVAQEECECPCQCREDTSTDICPAAASSDAGPSEDIPTCPPEYEAPVKRAVRFSRVRVDQLPACIHTDCEARSSEADCHGVLGCSWCRLAQDAVTPLDSAHCSAQESCYSGILGHPSPYSLVPGQTRRILSGEASERPLFRASPIGPVAGGIMAFFVLLAVTGWVYRRWSRGERRLLVNSSDQDRVIMDGGYEEDSPEDVSGSGHQNFGLHASSGITVVSPYRMNPTYRRPRGPGTDSDHGYSTMTPCGDQDSEIMSCLSSHNRRDKLQAHKHNPVSLQSVTSGVSSRTSSPVPQKHSEDGKDAGNSSDEGEASSNEVIDVVAGMTSLQQHGRNQIVVAATIHSVETT